MDSQKLDKDARRDGVQASAEQQRLSALRDLNVLDTAPESLFDRLTELAAQSFATPVALISFVDDHRQWFKSRVGLDATEASRDVAICDHAIRSDEVFVVLDAVSDPQFVDNPLVTNSPAIRFYAGAPLITAQGYRIGTLCVIDFKPRLSFSKAKRRKLASYAASVMEALAMRKNAHDAEVANARYKMLTDHASDIIFRYDRDGKIEFVSPSVRVLGYEPEDMVGRSAAEFLHPEDQLGVNLHTLGRLEGSLRSVIDRLETRIKCATGEWLWMESLAAPIFDEAGERVGVVATFRDISVRKMQETEVARARVAMEDHARRADEAETLAGLGHWRFDVAKNEFLGSREIYRIFGLPAGARLDFEMIKAMVHPHDVEQREAHFKLQVETGEPNTGSVFRIVRANGEIRHLESRAVVERGADGAVAALAGTVMDITARKTAEAAIAGAEARYRELAEHSSDVILRIDLTDSRQRISFASPSVRHLGFEPEEVVGLPRTAFIHPDDLQQPAVDPLAAAASQSPQMARQQEFRVRTKGGDYVWMEARRSVIHNEKGNPVEAISTLRDVTARKTAEAEMVRARQLAEEQAQRANAAEEVGGLGHGRFDLANNEVAWSPQLYKIYGLPENTKINLDLIRAMIHPDDLETYLGNFQHETETGEPKNGSVHRIVRADGQIRYLERRSVAERRPDGTVAAIVGTVMDITERKAAEAALEAARDAAEAGAAAKTDFLANMTHELRTPLNAIVGFSGILKETENLEPRVARQINLIWDASQTLLHVVNDVLDFSKLEAGGIEFEASPFDPGQLAETAVSILAGQAETKGLDLSVSVQGIAAEVLGDPARIRQVLLNLVSNAIKFTARGGVKVLVRQTADGDQMCLRVEVEDTGIGIASDQRETIFSRFAQADASVSRQYGGTGLGLAISKRIIESMGGRINVESVAGRGSTFWFEVSLPIAETRTLKQSVAGPREAVDQALRLLVVDDNAVNLELVCTLLEPFDLVIETANDGVEAVEAATRSMFDIILMDVQMPNMDGLTATRRIREAKQMGAARTPIIAMTANVLPEQVARCLDAGMDDHLGKPINIHALLEALDRWSSSEVTTQDQEPHQNHPTAA
jgi:PAS domain S-box-containing protein